MMRVPRARQGLKTVDGEGLLPKGLVPWDMSEASTQGKVDHALGLARNQLGSYPTDPGVRTLGEGKRSWLMFLKHSFRNCVATGSQATPALT